MNLFKYTFFGFALFVVFNLVVKLIAHVYKIAFTPEWAGWTMCSTAFVAMVFVGLMVIHDNGQEPIKHTRKARSKSKR